MALYNNVRPLHFNITPSSSSPSPYEKKHIPKNNSENKSSTIFSHEKENNVSKQELQEKEEQQYGSYSEYKNDLEDNLGTEEISFLDSDSFVTVDNDYYDDGEIYDNNINNSRNKIKSHIHLYNPYDDLMIRRNNSSNLNSNSKNRIVGFGNYGIGQLPIHNLDILSLLLSTNSSALSIEQPKSFMKNNSHDPNNNNNNNNNNTIASLCREASKHAKLASEVSLHLHRNNHPNISNYPNSNNNIRVIITMEM